MPRPITDKLHAIRKSGNQAAHEGKVDQQQAIWILKESYLIASYLFMAYDNGKQADCPIFNAPEQKQPQNQDTQEFAKKNKQLAKMLADKFQAEKLQECKSILEIYSCNHHLLNKHSC